MKFGPCLRNSVVSPKTGQPIAPGGKPFLLNLTSFHFKRAEQKQSSNTRTPRIAMNKAIGAFKKRLEDSNSLLQLKSREVHQHTHIYIGP